MSSALKPLPPPPSGGQSSPSNAPPAKPIVGSHTAPTSYTTNSLSHMPQANMHMGAIGPSVMNPGSIGPGSMGPAGGTALPAPMGMPAATPPPNIPNAHKGVVLGPSRPNMLPYVPNVHIREEESTALPATQNAAQLMHRTQAQSNGTPGLEPCPAVKPSVPAPAPPQPQPQVSAPAPDTARMEQPPAPPPTQNHVPAVHEAAKQPEPEKVVEKPAVAEKAPEKPAVVPAVAEEPRMAAAASVVANVPVPNTTQATVIPEAPAEAAPAPPKPTVPKEAPKAPSTMKLATTPRTVTRKREAKPPKSDESPPKTSSPAKSDKSSTSGVQKTPPSASSSGGVAKSKARLSDDDRKSKRNRTRTQPYQSPIPELALITKLSSSSSTKNLDEKLIVFYKNEFLAVRNAEGGFYVCQAVQNVYKSSSRIRIRWLSQDKTDKTYAPDFYDFTEFDCILTNINMNRVEKGKYNLPKDELERTENILKRALAVESGDAAPSLTEEHPDGLDLSLFRDESQLKKKRKAAKRKSSEPLTADSSDDSRKKSPSKPKTRKLTKSARKPPRNNQIKEAVTNSLDKKKKSRTDSGRAERAKRRQEASPPVKTSPVVDQKKARVLAKVVKNAVPAVHSKNQKKGKKAVPPVKATVPVVASSSKASKSTRSQAAAAAAASPAATRRTKSNRK